MSASMTVCCCFLGRGQHPHQAHRFLPVGREGREPWLRRRLAAAGARQLAQVHPVGGDPAARGQPAAGQARLCRCAVPHHRPVGQASGLRRGAGPCARDRRRAPAASGCPRMPSRRTRRLISLRHAVLRPQGATEDAVPARRPRPADPALRRLQRPWPRRGLRVPDGVRLGRSTCLAIACHGSGRALRGTGVGSSLLSYALRDLALLDRTRPIWCNARLSARFYERHGWQAVSDPFDNGAAGAVRMLRAAPPTSGVSNVYSGALS